MFASLKFFGERGEVRGGPKTKSPRRNPRLDTSKLYPPDAAHEAPRSPVGGVATLAAVDRTWPCSRRAFTSHHRAGRRQGQRGSMLTRWLLGQPDHLWLRLLPAVTCMGSASVATDVPRSTLAPPRWILWEVPPHWSCKCALGGSRRTSHGICSSTSQIQPQDRMP